jgi:hypothetical protein
MAEPPPEVRAILKSWIAQQREKYGPDWKEILAAEMAAKTEPVISAMLKLTRRA